jgi:predicted branched-subunit amino acid permease
MLNRLTHMRQVAMPDGFATGMNPTPSLMTVTAYGESFIEEGIPAILIVLTILVVNARHMLYSASMAPYYAQLPAQWKIALSWLLTDEAYVTTHHRYQQNTRGNARWYALGTGLALWGTWQISTALGILAGSAIPTDWPLAFALPLTFLALLVPQLIDQPTWAAALVAALAALVLAPLPFRLGLFIAAILGIAAGMLVEHRKSQLTEGPP